MAQIVPSSGLEPIAARIIGAISGQKRGHTSAQENDAPLNE
jgi:hypothetical protein